MKSCAPSGAGISTPLSPTGLARGYILTPLRGWDLDAAFTHGLAPVATFLRRSAAGISTRLSPTGLRPWRHSYAAPRLGSRRRYHPRAWPVATFLRRSAAGQLRY